MDHLVIIFRLSLAAALGATVGLERGYFGKAAGLRTHGLVCVASALMMIVSIHTGLMHHGDPTRIAAQVVTGIGFIGAGTILRYGASIKGLTTAASLWAIAGIGLAVGSGLYIPAVFATGITLIFLLLLSRVEPKGGRE